MSFLNAAMAIGAAAFVFPLAIHLLFRSRFRTLDWGAMFLLQDVINANRRRMQWHQWILLALRCAIPILLALAMARPLLSSIGGQSLTGTSPVSLIVMIDESRSMSAGGRSTRTIEFVTELLDAMSRRDEVILMSSSHLHSPPTRGGAREAREQLAKLRFDGAPMHLPTTLQSAIDACREAAHPHRRVVLVSDFQENTFQISGAQNASSILDSIDHLSERLSGFDPRPRIDFLDVSETEADSHSLANVVVETIGTTTPAILVGQPVPLTATIRNDSELPVTNLRAGWIIDGRAVETQTVSIESQGTASLNWQTTFEKPGGVSIGLSVEHADAIAADNRREWAIEVLSPIRVWLVDGQPSQEALQSETDFLKVALSPFAFQSARHNGATHRTASRRRGGDTQDLLSTRVMNERTLVTQLGDYLSEQPGQAGGESPADTPQRPDLIVLANVTRPPALADGSDPLASYLHAGGRVLFFDGDQVDASAWADCPWLPATPQDTVEAQQSAFRIEAPGAKLAVWQSLGDAEDSLFDAVSISRLRLLSLPDKSTSVWLRTDKGNPLVAAKTISSVAEPAASDAGGAAPTGRVVQFAIPCDTAWSNLPLRPVFLPMMHELVLELVGADIPGSVLPGTAMTIAPLPALDGDDPGAWQVSTPDGKTRSMPVSSSLPLVFSETSVVGAYRFRSVGDRAGDEPSAVTKDADEKPASRRTQVRVVGVPASESVLHGVAPELLAECAERLSAGRYTDAETLVAASERDRYGVEIWRPLLWLLLAVMLGEVLWQQVGVTRSANRFARPHAKVTS